MAQEFQTSFIPKKSFDTEKPSAGGGGILFLISLILFILSLLGAGGAFAYERYLGSSIAAKSQALEDAKSKFEPESIRVLSRLDAKLNQAQSLVDSHIAVSGIFDLVEEITLQTVRFSNFRYTFTPQGVQLSMSGEAVSFASVALQSDEFAKNRFITEPVFDGLAVNDIGNVTFSVTALIDPSVVSYSNQVQTGAQASLDTAPTTAQANGEGTPVSEVSSL